MNKDRTVTILVGAVLAVLCCVCVVVVIFGWLVYKATAVLGGNATAGAPPIDTTVPTATLIPAASQQPARLQAADMLRTLETVDVPASDLIAIAERLEGAPEIQPTLPPPALPPKVGDEHVFWVQNSDLDETVQVRANLVYINEHAYLWAEKGFQYDRKDMEQILDAFSTVIYPKEHAIFGSEWNPGVDGDPRVYVLWTGQLGSGVAGSFSSIDEYPPQAQQYSNAHEMLSLNTDILQSGQDYVDGVMAHELQHMIQWNQDKNEEGWVTEGLSELAALVTGYWDGGFVDLYNAQPDMPLDDWSLDPKVNLAHYGASFSFFSYLYTRFGVQAIQALEVDPKNGLSGVDDALLTLGVKDPLTGKPATTDEVFADWVVATYLQNGKVADGRYVDPSNTAAPKPEPTEWIDSCPVNDRTRTVSQYGVDYISISCLGDHQITFQGQMLVSLLPQKAHSGEFAFWSNKGDESDMRLLRSFDFSGVTGSLTMKYWTWYNIEKDYDYVYLVASEDGKNWQILKTSSGTTSNPNGNSYGWAYTGDSHRWLQETVDLSQFAGKKIQLGFEYVTDAETYGEGFLVDDVSIPQINYKEDFEHGDGGWQGQGFVRESGLLPQTYRVSLITMGRVIGVHAIQLTQDGQAVIPFSIGKDVSEVVLVASGTTRHTRQPAFYHYTITDR